VLKQRNRWPLMDCLDYWELCPPVPVKSELKKTSYNIIPSWCTARLGFLSPGVHFRLQSSGLRLPHPCLPNGWLRKRRQPSPLANSARFLEAITEAGRLASSLSGNVGTKYRKSQREPCVSSQEVNARRIIIKTSPIPHSATHSRLLKPSQGFRFCLTLSASPDGIKLPNVLLWWPS